ncbi:hypothetical protein QEK83_000121 [Stenotrophomonas maltophilia]|uniref:Uncharacterized protein n=1 Tax=Stenotrophomonas maltophilia TaxID=40324 RepID=A0AAI9C7B9_STEMA|nr:hypothetical protein [Stenotrophomonas maltophilia]
MDNFYINHTNLICNEDNASVRFEWCQTLAGYHVFDAFVWNGEGWADQPYKIMADECSRVAAIEAWEQLEERLLSTEMEEAAFYENPSIYELYALSRDHWSSESIKW